MKTYAYKNVKSCPVCGHEAGLEANFCCECGTELVRGGSIGGVPFPELSKNCTENTICPCCRGQLEPYGGVTDDEEFTPLYYCRTCDRAYIAYGGAR